MTLSSSEIVLLAILRDRLNDEDIGPADNFFAVGGDSLLAIDVIAAARAHGLRMTVRDVLTRATIRELAATAVATDADAQVQAAMNGPFPCLDHEERQRLPAGVVAALPASALQLGMIYLADRAESPKPYNDFLGLRIRAAFSERALRAALRLAMSRHRVLRASFDLDSFAEAQQLIWGDVAEPVTVAWEENECRAAEIVRTWQQEILAEGIPTDHPPAFRCQVVASASSFRLSMAIHHAIMDGWSLSRLVADVLTCYDAECAGRPARLPAIPEHGYSDFVALERAASGSAEAARFWRGQADHPPLLLDQERFAPANASRARFLPIPDDRWQALRDTATGWRIPVKSLLLAAHGWALGQLTGRARVVSGLVVNGRPEIEGADQLVGLFLNTVPVSLPGVKGTWAELAAAARDAESDGIGYRRYPLARIQQELGRPPFDVSFNFTHFRPFNEINRLPGMRTDSWWSFDIATFPMHASIVVDDPVHGTGLLVTFDPSLLAADRIERYLALMHGAFSDAPAER